MKTLKALLQKYKDIVLYVVFGGLTTLVNIVSFYVLEQLLAVATVPATCVAWALSVLFAYVTNRRWVFESKENTRRGILREMGSFFPVPAALRADGRGHHVRVRGSAGLEQHDY